MISDLVWVGWGCSKTALMIMRLFLGEDPVAIAELAETRLVMAPLSRLVLKIEIVLLVN